MTVLPVAEKRTERSLLRLHRALSLPEFWSAGRELIAGTVRCHSISIYFNYYGIGRDFKALHHQVAPGNHEPWERRRRFSPTPHYLQRNVGRRIFGLSELIPNRRVLETTEYFKNVMAVEGWRNLVCLTYWQKRNPAAMIVVRKSADQGEFSDNELKWMHGLYGHMGTALHRVGRVQREQNLLACLAAQLRRMPAGFLVLDDRLKPIERNSAALDACLRLNCGEVRLRYHPAKCFSLPAAVSDACRELAQAWLSHPSEGPGPELTRAVQAPSGKASEMEISVRLIRPNRLFLVKPHFLVQFAGPPASSVPLSPEGARRLHELSAREREVALAALSGLGNAEIALQLGKTESTVKLQLNSIFSKFGIRRRSQLAVVFR